MEALWLAAVFLVPLAFLPEDSVISPFRIVKITLLRVFVGGIAIGWLVEFVRAARPVRLPLTGAEFRGWLQRSPTHWLLLAVALYGLVTLVATLTSLSFRTSLWGKLPGDEGYSLYTSTAYFVLFFAIATHVRTRPQLLRLLGVVAAAGSLSGLYGVLQYNGLDPFDWPLIDGRIVSTSGNPIFAGSIFVLTIPVTLALGLVATMGRRRAQAIAWATGAALQGTALFLTASRGPLIGAAVAFVVLLPLTWRAWFAGRVRARTQALVAVALVAALSVGGLAAAQTQAGGVVVQRFEQGAAFVQGGFAGSSGVQRRHLLEGSLTLIAERPTPDFADDKLEFLRPLVGYGPDTFESVFPLGAPESTTFDLGTLFTYAHNHVLHETIELGGLGGLALLFLFGAAVFAGAVLYQQRGPPGIGIGLLLAGLLAAVAGRFAEQLFGIPRVGDLTLLWALLGALAAIPHVLAVVPDGAVTPRQPWAAPWTSRSARSAAAGVAIVAVVLVTWTQSVNQIRASSLAASSIDATADGRLDDGLALIDRAISLAPDVRIFHQERGTLFGASSENTQDEAARLRFAELAYAADLEAVDLQPLSYQGTVAAAQAALRLARLGDVLARLEGVGLYTRLTQLRPDTYEAFDAAAAAFLELGRADLARAVATDSLSKPRLRDSERSRAYLLRAIAEAELGDALASVEGAATALRLGGLNDIETDAANQIVADTDAAEASID